jgi:2-phosphosulfolactate phosphatase
MRSDILVIVDTLSFSTATATAIEHGGIILPCSAHESPGDLAARLEGTVAVGRKDVPALGRFSLSPLSFLAIEPGTRVVLTSPNGATCSRHAREVPHLFIGAPINARAVAAAVSALLEETDLNVTIVACGERWERPGEDGELRVAVEDYLGAGAVIARLDCSKSPEARICEGAFTAAGESFADLIYDCASGLELRERGFEGDVIHAAQLDRYDSVPVMRGEMIRVLS